MSNKPTCGACSQPDSLQMSYQEGTAQGGCNGCTCSPAHVWAIMLRGLQLRLCDACFDTLIEQRSRRQTKKDAPANVLLTLRHKLCEELYQVGLDRYAGGVKQLLAQIKEVDQELPVPDFELPVDVPEPGDLIYLPFHCSIDHGYDDVWGGAGVVQKVKERVSGGEPAFFVTAHEHPGDGYNWKFLGAEQAEHKRRCSGWARPDPDLG